MKKLRKSRKWTQELCAEKADVHVNVVGRVERGAMAPTIIVVLKFARAFDVSPGELFEPFDKQVLKKLRLTA